MSVTISQGDYVYYQDTSTGAPTGWAWTFQGGSPTGSSSQNPVVRYLSPSYSGYGTTLIASKGILSSSKTSSNIILVNPESLYISVDATPNTVSMGSTITYTVVGPTASVAYYTWNLPGVAGYTGSNIVTTQYVTTDSWVNVTGSEYGATYSSYSAYATVYATSVLGNTNANNALVTYTKNGPPEQVNFGDQDIYDPYTTYYTAANTVLSTTMVGLPGAGWVVQLSFSGTEMDNQFFRGHGEFLYYISSNMDAGDNLFTADGILFGQLVASAPAFTLLGVPFTGWELLNRYTIGQYMLPGDINTYFSNVIYLGDVYQALAELAKPPRSWTESQIFDLFFETSVATQTSKSLELDFTLTPLASSFGFDGYNGLSGGHGGCCLPSRLVAGGDIIITVNFYYSNDGSINGIDPGQTDTINITISDATINGGMGNSPDNLVVLAQDTANGDGIATLMQAAFDDYFVNTLGNVSNTFVQASASPDYAYRADSMTYDINVFNGLKITIISNQAKASIGFSLVKMEFTDNFINLGPGYKNTSAFGPSPLPQGNWTCFYYNYIANPYQVIDTGFNRPKRGFSYYIV